MSRLKTGTAISPPRSPTPSRSEFLAYTTPHILVCHHLPPPRLPLPLPSVQDGLPSWSAACLLWSEALALLYAVSEASLREQPTPPGPAPLQRSHLLAIALLPFSTQRLDPLGSVFFSRAAVSQSPSLFQKQCPSSYKRPPHLSSSAMSRNALK